MKITDHTNNQNGKTARDLQSNNPIQTRLQAEFNSAYKGKFYYRIKRGEHVEWDPAKVIENDLAARILLAFDLKRPWECHQTYKLFDESHSAIFGRPEVDADRVVSVHDIYQCMFKKLELMENQLFAWYSLSRSLLLYLLREALETDSEGKKFCLNPSEFTNEPKGRARVLGCIDKVSQVVVRLLDSEVKRRDDDPSAPFDYKRALKSPKEVRELRSTIVAHYQIAVDSKLALTFSEEWEKSKGK